MGILCLMGNKPDENMTQEELLAKCQKKYKYCWSKKGKVYHLTSRGWISIKKTMHFSTPNCVTGMAGNYLRLDKDGDIDPRFPANDNWEFGNNPPANRRPCSFCL